MNALFYNQWIPVGNINAPVSSSLHNSEDFASSCSTGKSNIEDSLERSAIALLLNVVEFSVDLKINIPKQK